MAFNLQKLLLDESIELSVFNFAVNPNTGGKHC